MKLLGKGTSPFVVRLVLIIPEGAASHPLVPPAGFPAGGRKGSPLPFREQCGQLFYRRPTCLIDTVPTESVYRNLVLALRQYTF